MKIKNIGFPGFFEAQTNRPKSIDFGQPISGFKKALCWAHLYRDFVKMSERSGEAGRLGQQLKKLTERLFRLWGQYGEGKLAPNVWESAVNGIRFRMHGLLERGALVKTREHERSERSLTKNTCKSLF